jgi:fucose permease
MTVAVRPALLTTLANLSMMALALGLNLLPVYLTTLGTTYGGADGLSQERLGRLGGITFTGLVIGILVTGPLADRWGAKLFVQFGNTAVAAGLIGAAFAPDYGWLCCAMALLGFGAGVFDMVLSPVVAALHPARRAAAMNWLHSFYCVGAVATVLAGTVALGFGVGWRGACLMLTPLPLGLLCAFAPLRFPELVSDAGRTSLPGLLRDRWFLGALLAIFLGGATELGMAQWLPAYAEASLGFPAWVGGAALLLFSLAMAGGRMIVGAYGSRWEHFALLAIGGLSSAALFVAASFLPWHGVALACCVVVGLTGSFLWPTILAIAADRHPDGGATMFGALAALGNAGGIVMPWAVGWVADRSDLHWGLAVSAIAPALMVPVVLALRRGAHRPAAGAAAPAV